MLTGVTFVILHLIFRKLESSCDCELRDKLVGVSSLGKDQKVLTMSEKKSFFRAARKQLTRQQEKLMQKFGKGVHEEDQEYSEHVENFQTQALAAMSAASEGMRDAIKAIYDPDWAQSEEIYSNIETLEHIYADCLEKITEEVVDPLTTYTSQFSVIKSRIAKRDRRALDYDRAKRLLESSKEKNNTHKQQQAQEEFDSAKAQFTSIDRECHDMLPSFYQGRVPFYASLLHSYFTSEAIFHGASHSVHSRLQQCTTVLQDTASEQSHHSNSKSFHGVREPQQQGFRQDDKDSILNELSSSDSDIEKEYPEHDDDGGNQHDSKKREPSVKDKYMANEENYDISEILMSPAPDPPQSNSSTPEILEVRVATHNYTAQDADELELAKGDVIEVLPIEDPEAEEEGWLFGRTQTGKGVFPINHTKIKE
eukprot:gene8675-1068_t